MDLNFADGFRCYLKMLRPVYNKRFYFYILQPIRSGRQGCPVAPILYIIQAEPMACAIRGTDEIKGIQMPGSENVLESKICMFADDTQLLIEMKNQLNWFLNF